MERFIEIIYVRLGSNWNKELKHFFFFTEENLFFDLTDH